MMALENKETIQRSSEASLKCLETNGFPYGNSNDGFPELKEEISVHSGGDVVEPVHSISSEFLELPSELHSKPTYHHDFGSRSTFYPDSKRFSCYAPFNMFSQGYPSEFQFQDFQYFVVIDFEATCYKEKKNPHPQEIIEFPSVIVSSATGQLEACFQTYVRPTCNQLLSDFCKDLTGIQQIQVDRAPFFNRWINLRIPVREVFGGVRCNQKEAVKMAGLAWQGRAHCGLDDAKNTGYQKFSITNTPMWQTTDGSLSWKPSPDTLSFALDQPYKLEEMHSPVLQYHTFCYCAVKNSKGMVRKPGPKQGSFFFGCGNWTATRGFLCHYFEWAST
ncbi:hypothetical protein P3X46_033768 [Hevea brasiliensis]|uniref:GRF-type domain-containing protein n=1 Tax=Hevea brasiliensis TaxID=3981 RepID=A0ABQ9K9T9_HEVBR|nr:hypothetical protein P3X46_033768 [Hevea brasiliensis]